MSEQRCRGTIGPNCVKYLVEGQRLRRCGWVAGVINLCSPMFIGSLILIDVAGLDMHLLQQGRVILAPSIGRNLDTDTNQIFTDRLLGWKYFITIIPRDRPNPLVADYHWVRLWRHTLAACDAALQVDGRLFK